MAHSDMPMIDPQLRNLSDQTQPQSTQAQPRQNPTLPFHNFDRDRDEADDVSDGEGNDGNTTEKRRKLNLLKCKQCRDARKKCVPEDRVWPGQKCQRCKQHKPNELDCSEPQLNNRKRGPNLPKDGKPPAQRSDTTRSTPDRLEPRPKEKPESTPTVDNARYERPLRTPAAPPVKREFRQSSPLENAKPAGLNKDDQHPASAYQPLGASEFRILHLAPGTQDQELLCWFETVTLGDSPEYEAISYLYGGGAAQTSVSIKLRDSQGKLHSIFIRSNLANALKALRHPVNNTAYWADALCINHSIPEERGQQVEKKRDIFHKAKNVCFWLGEDPNDEKALKFIPQILNLTEVDNLVRDRSSVDNWVAFVGLLHNTVFSRLWFVQELAVARNVTVHCGLPAVHYGDLVDAVAIFVSFRDDLSLLFRQNKKDYKLLSDRKMSMAERFIDVSSNALRIPPPPGNIQRLLTLEALVSQLSDLSATDLRDRIFAVWGIAKDGLPLKDKTLTEYHQGPGKINYKTSVAKVYLDFVMHAIKGSNSLDIICRQWFNSASDELPTLPTWVRPLQSYQPPSSNVSERTNADSLVGLPSQNTYNACKGRIPSPKFSDSETSPSLSTRGIRIDTIKQLGFRASEGIIFKEWLKLGGCPLSGEVVPENFWRTLVADRGPNGSNPPSWYSRVFLYCHHHLTPTAGDINTNRLMEESEPSGFNEAGSSLVVKFLQRVQSVIWNRRFLVTEDKGYIGLAPMAADKDDWICVLWGCSVPVVLRKRVGEDGEEYWNLVGECYVHGIMNGEAVERLRDDNVGELFEIR